MFSIVLAVAFLSSTVAIAAPDCDKLRNDVRACLACNIYHEARNQPEIGQHAVAHVTYNRVESRHYPNDICSVVWESRRHYRTKRLTPMFSWTLDGKSDRAHNADKWEQAHAIADSVMDAIEAGVSINDITQGALYYHADYVNPSWAQSKVFTIQIGNHLFYTNPPQMAKK